MFQNSIVLFSSVFCKTEQNTKEKKAPRTRTALEHGKFTDLSSLLGQVGDNDEKSVTNISDFLET